MVNNNNNNEIITNNQLTNNSEYQTLANYCQEHNEKTITREQLGLGSDTFPSLNNPKPNNLHPAIVLFGGTLLVAVLVVVMGLVVKNKAKKVK